MAQQMNSEGTVHAHRTAKVIEIVASSTQSFEDAITKGLADAAKTTRGITGCHVENWTVKCDDGEPVEYRVALRLVFGVEQAPAA